MKNQILLENDENEFDKELLSRLGDVDDSSNNQTQPSCDEKVK